MHAPVTASCAWPTHTFFGACEHVELRLRQHHDRVCGDARARRANDEASHPLARLPQSCSAARAVAPGSSYPNSHSCNEMDFR
eukprot:364199-Chlamydomonas_euryale.AAC.7